jgi:hypothetical protein
MCGMSRARITGAVLLAGAALAAPSVAQAATVPWGGSGANDLGPASILLSTQNGRVSVPNVQLVLSCTDLSDGQVTDQAWYASSARPTTLRLNRFSTTLTADAGGFQGTGRLVGTLRSNGTGTATIDVQAEAQDAFGATIQRCQGRVVFTLRRGRAG